MHTSFILPIFAVLVMANVAFADTAVVTNDVSASVSSGGNVAEEGAVVEGEARTSVFSETSVNGAVVEEEMLERLEDGGATQTTSAEYGAPDDPVRVRTRIQTSVGAGVSDSSEVFGNVDGASENKTTINSNTDRQKGEQRSDRSIINDLYAFLYYAFTFKWI